MARSIRIEHSGAFYKGSDPRKLALAPYIWERTAVSQGWLAKHLEMGSAANVSQQIRRARFSCRFLPKDLKRLLSLSRIEP